MSLSHHFLFMSCACYTTPLLFSLLPSLGKRNNKEIINMSKHMNSIMYKIIPVSVSMMMTVTWVQEQKAYTYSYWNNLLPVYLRLKYVELVRFNFCSDVCLSCYWLFVPFHYLQLCNLHLLNDPECLENRNKDLLLLKVCWSTADRRGLAVKC